MSIKAIAAIILQNLSLLIRIPRTFEKDINELKVKAKLRFSAPSAGIAEIAKR